VRRRIRRLVRARAFNNVRTATRNRDLPLAMEGPHLTHQPVYCINGFRPVRGGNRPSKIAFDRACPSVTQKRPLVSHFPTARWVATQHRKRIYRPAGVQQTAFENGYWRKRGRQSAAAVIRHSVCLTQCSFHAHRPNRHPIEAILDVREPNVVRPVVSAGGDRVVEAVVRAVHKQPARAALAHIGEGDFLRTGEGGWSTSSRRSGGNEEGAGRYNGRTSCNHFATQCNQIRRNRSARGETGRDTKARKAQ
jgi:hypothetical protein